VSHGESFERLRESFPTGLAVVDNQLRYVQVNDVVAQLNGLPQEEHIGKAIIEIRPDIAPLITPFVTKVFETGEPLLNVDIRRNLPEAQTRSGKRLVSFIPLFGLNGQLSQVGILVLVIENGREQADQPVSLALRGKIGRKDARPNNDRSEKSRVRLLRDVALALTTAVEMLEQSQANAHFQDPDIDNGIDFYEEVSQFESELIKRALKKTGGNQKNAARLLNIRSTTLNAMVKRYRLDLNW
jgi:transcriptional regulator with PAS, ATPase and Fis domain